MRETWVQSLGWEDPVEESIATHPSIFTWRIPGTEEPGGLQSMGSQSDMTEQLSLVGKRNRSLNYLTYLAIYIPGVSNGKESACNYGDPGSIPGSARFPGEGNGNPLQYSCLENTKDRGTWWAAVHGVTKNRT